MTEKAEQEPSQKASEIAREALMEAARRLNLSIHQGDEEVRRLLQAEYPYGRREGKWMKAWDNAVNQHIQERIALRAWNRAAASGESHEN